MSLQPTDSRGLSCIYDSVCYSSASLPISVTLTQLHRGRGREGSQSRMQRRNKRSETNGSETERKMSISHGETDKNKNGLNGERQAVMLLLGEVQGNNKKKTKVEVY